MRIVVTGASGFIGAQIIPILDKAGVELLLVGRDKVKLNKHFPQFRAITYENLEKEATGFDALVHLAIRNNDHKGSIKDFRTVNVDFLETVLNAARNAGIKTFIHTTTLHVLDENNSSAYAQTKHEAEELLTNVRGISVVNIRLPAVYGEIFKGKLALLMRFPAFIRPIAFQLLASLKPTVHVKHVASAILGIAASGTGTDLIVTDRQHNNPVYKTVKKSIDIAFVLFVVGFLWWALIAAWIAVKLTSPGPGIFAQERVGKGGKPFTCYKFRTMGLGTKQVGTHEITTDSITGIGHFLRRTKIDELPQIWNILKNELSLIGPRPCLPAQTELIAARGERGVLDVKGGITGWAQVKNVDMSDPVKLAKLDEEYTLLRTIPLDIKIIIQTATGHGQGDKVR
jgi:lipopolysaccharide/colanic/teichoic acid biosynthesis glycosyltransferase